MSARQASELLYDSEAALRLVDSAIEEIRVPDGRRADHGDAARAAQLRDALTAANGAVDPIGLSRILARGYTEVVSVLGSLRESRAVLERATVPDFEDVTTQQLDYASSVLTEMEHRLAHLASVLDPTALGAVSAAKDAKR